MHHPAFEHEGVQYPEGTTREVVPLTHTGKFMQHLVSYDMLDFVAGAWRTFQDYFHLLLEFARMGRTQRVFLVQRDVELRLMDMCVCSGGGGVAVVAVVR